MKNAQKKKLVTDLKLNLMNTDNRMEDSSKTVKVIVNTTGRINARNRNLNK